MTAAVQARKYRPLVESICKVCDREFVDSMNALDVKRRNVCHGCRKWHSWCNGCDRARLRSEFNKGKNAVDGLQNRCIRCVTERRGDIRVRDCGHCGDSFVVDQHGKYNGRAPWMCGPCKAAVKRCAGCDTVKPVDAFGIATSKPDGRTAHCKPCRAARYAKLDISKRSKKKLAGYGLTWIDYERMLAEQGGVCAICGGVETTRHNDGSGRIRTLAVDHDHKTGAVRALLCSNCNKAIGCMADDVERLRAAAEYIERHRVV